MKSTMWIVLGGVAMLSVLDARDANALGSTTTIHGNPVTGVCATPMPIRTCAARVDNSGPQPRRTIYLNRAGGSYSFQATPNSAKNEISFGTNQTGTIPGVEIDNASWQLTVQCVKDYYAEFNIDIVEQEPDAPAVYTEVAVGGRPEDIGLSSGMGGGLILGIASTNQLADGCDIEERGIAFAFAENVAQLAPLNTATGYGELCITIAHEAGHLLGLEHEVDHSDLMSYETGSVAQKSFIDKDSLCGTYEASPTPCTCGDESKQNTHRVLTDNLGPNETVKPTVSITSPAAGATVKPGFFIIADATDNNYVAKVELVIDGNVVASSLLPPFKLQAPLQLPVGALSYEVRAVDKSSNNASTTSNVIVEPGCTEDKDCGDNEQCLNSACLGDVGHECSDSTDCLGELCVAPPGHNTEKFCSHSCTPGDGSCPDGFACDKSTGGLPKCNPAEAEGCGCRAGAQRGSAGTLSGLAMLGVLALFLRRRRRS